MDHDGVDGVLYFVADPGGEPADGRHAAGQLQFRFDLLDRFQIVQGDQRAQSLAAHVIMDKIH